jgi:hypothetical protein
LGFDASCQTAGKRIHFRLFWLCKLADPANEGTQTISRPFRSLNRLRRGSNSQFIEFDAEISLKFCEVINFLIDKKSVSTAILYANSCKVPCEQIMTFSWSMINILKKIDSARNKIDKIINLLEKLKHLKNQWVTFWPKRNGSLVDLTPNIQ